MLAAALLSIVVGLGHLAALGDIRSSHPDTGRAITHRAFCPLLSQTAAEPGFSMLALHQNALQSPPAHRIFNESYYFKLQRWDTHAGPDNGVNACAWVANKILQAGINRTYGDNPNYVPSVEYALKHDPRVSYIGSGSQGAAAAVQGDIVIEQDQDHIGICTERSGPCTLVQSNSSSRGCYCWQSDYNFFPSYDSPNSRFYHIKS